MGPCFSSSASPCLLASGHKGLLRLGRSWPARSPTHSPAGHSSSKRDSEGHFGQQELFLGGCESSRSPGPPPWMKQSEAGWGAE